MLVFIFIFNLIKPKLFKIYTYQAIEDNTLIIEYIINQQQKTFKKTVVFVFFNLY